MSLPLDSVLVLAVDAPEDGNFLVIPELGLMLWTLIFFGITLLVVRRFAFPRIGAGLDRRRRAVEGQRETAERTREEADRILAEYREQLREARRQAEEIVSDAKRSGEEVERRALEEARQAREDLLASTREEIRGETRKAIEGLRQEVGELTAMATEKVTGRPLDGRREMVDEALGELDFERLSEQR